jgi:hypothetical protein
MKKTREKKEEIRNSCMVCELLQTDRWNTRKSAPGSVQKQTERCYRLRALIYTDISGIKPAVFTNSVTIITLSLAI